MAWIHLLVFFIVFIVVVAVLVLAWRWLCAQFGIGEPISRVGLWVLGAAALIFFLLRIVAPLLS